MSLSVLPWKSHVHRNAAKALLRRLLSLSRRAVSDHGARSAFRNFVCHKFRQHRCVTSRHILGAAFRQGYEAVSLLQRSADGDQTATCQIDEVIRQIPVGLQRPPRSILENARTSSVRPPRPTTEPSQSILARPRPSVPAKRHVPVFVNARGYPMLRIKKPQPKALSGYLRQRFRAHQNRIDALHEIEEDLLPLSKLEDTWDQIIKTESDSRRRSKLESGKFVSWAQEPLAARRALLQMIANDFRKKNEMALKMREIVQKERRLAESEAAVRREERRAARLKASMTQV